MTQDLQLEVGQFAEEVTVEGGPPMVDTSSRAVSTLVDRQFVENVPLNGRSFQSLRELTPRVVLTEAPITNPGQFSVDGQRANANYFTVDGVSANASTSVSAQSFRQAAGSLPNLTVLGVPVADALFEQFRVATLGLPLSGFDLPIITPHDALWGQTPIFGHNQDGKAVFRTALREFRGRWHGKRPAPWEMFDSFNDAGMGNSTRFSRNWLFGYGQMGLAVDDVRGTASARVVAVRNTGGLAVPFAGCWSTPTAPASACTARRPCGRPTDAGRTCRWRAARRCAG